MPTSTDGKCPTCRAEVHYAYTTKGYVDHDTGDSEDPIAIYRCVGGCGLIPEDDLDWSPPAPPKPLVPVEDGDVVEYRTSHGMTAMGTVSEIGEAHIWLYLDGFSDHDLIVEMGQVVRVVPWDEWLKGLD